MSSFAYSLALGMFLLVTCTATSGAPITGPGGDLLYKKEGVERIRFSNGMVLFSTWKARVHRWTLETWEARERFGLPYESLRCGEYFYLSRNSAGRTNMGVVFTTDGIAYEKLEDAVLGVTEEVSSPVIYHGLLYGAMITPPMGTYLIMNEKQFQEMQSCIHKKHQVPKLS